MRLTGSATLTQNTQGARWFSSVTLYQNLGASRVLAYQVGGSGESNLEVPLSDYGFRLIYRQSILREWLFRRSEQKHERVPPERYAEPQRAHQVMTVTSVPVRLRDH